MLRSAHILAVLSWLLTFSTAMGNPDDCLPYSIVFHKGMAGYDTFRIPAVLKAGDGSILGFAEARKASASDTGHIDLVVRRSRDDGKTWDELSVIWSDPGNVCGNPAPVLDMTTGRIYLLCTWNNGNDNETSINNRTSLDTRKVFVIYSEDNGATWSQPQDITSQVKDSSWTWYATGPGHGIQMTHGKYRNRIVIPCDHGIFNGNTSSYASHVIYSDDGGRTWAIGGSISGGNECSVAELNDGTIMLNMRWQPSLEWKADMKDKYRRVAFSHDGGESFDTPYIERGLPDPTCQGAIMTMGTNSQIPVLLFSNPRSSEKRENLSVSVSKDNGRTWSVLQKLSSIGAYSDIVHIRKNRIGILCESGIENSGEAIRFYTIDIINNTIELTAE